MSSIINPNKKPKNVVLLCGGNDCDQYPIDQVINEYEGLISDVRTQCGPSVPILLCKVPPRRGNADTAASIAQLNAYLETRGRKSDCVYDVDVAPKSQSLFSSDHIH